MAAEESSLRSIDEGARKRFEGAWQQGRPQRIEEYLPPQEDPRYLATLDKQAGAKVTIMGTEKDNTITVSSVKAAQ